MSLTACKMAAFSSGCVRDFLGGGALGVPLTGTAEAGTLSGFLPPPPPEENLEKREDKSRGRGGVYGEGEEEGLLVNIHNKIQWNL